MAYQQLGTSPGLSLPIVTSRICEALLLVTDRLLVRIPWLKFDSPSGVFHNLPFPPQANT